ncbi:MAG: methyltransferase domain-containing protein [Ruminococcus sp.]|nr:methyltransferase domain-containing protein [Ruminococcus sp.]
MKDWNPEQYSKFMEERTLPAIDLASRLNVRNPQKILDLGCGTGNSTQILKDKFPFARIIGADNSHTMLEEARKLHPDMEFILFDGSSDYSVLGNDYDIVFSNACIQWIPDHKTLIPKLMGLLKTGGMLAAQAPMQSEHPVQQLIQKLAFSDKWSRLIKNPRTINTLTQGRYFDILASLTNDFSIWKTVYGHRMPDHQSIIEWYKGTGLRPYLAQLSDEDAVKFEAELLEKVRHAYPVHANGEVLFKFPRIFFTAVKQ